MTASVYVATHDYGTKIGITRGDPRVRGVALANGSGLRVELSDMLIYSSWAEARFIKRQALGYLRPWRTRGEWHECDAQTAWDALRLADRDLRAQLFEELASA